MRFSRSIALAVAVSAAAALPATGSAAAKAPTPAKTKIVKEISFRNGQYVSLHKRVRTCAVARTDVRAAAALRRSALHRTSVRLTVRQLKTRRAKMNRAVLTLSRAAKRCAVAPVPQTVVTVQQAPAPAVTTVPGPGTVTVIPGPPSVTPPSTPPAPTPGVTIVIPGGGQVVIPGPSVDVTIPPLDGLTGIVPIDLTQVLSGSGIDLGQVLEGGLPDVIRIVDIDDLDEGVCVAGAVCVAVDPAALLAAVQQTIDLDETLPGAGSLIEDPTALVGQVQDLVSVGDLDGLVNVHQTASGVLQLVPVGPLAELTGAAGLPQVPLGALLLG